MKRPAAAMKRPAAAQSVSDDAPAEPPRKRPATASVSIEGAADIEAACGEWYRREVSDLGLGLQKRENAGEARVLGVCCHAGRMQGLATEVSTRDEGQRWE